MTLHTAGYIEERLIDAVRVWEAIGDREMNWLRHADSSNMPLTVKESSQMDEKRSLLEEAGLGADLPLSRNDITAKRIDMAEECITWMAYAEPELREVVCCVIRFKMRGRKQRNWTMIRRHLRAFDVSADALRKRYWRGLNQVADKLNGQEKAFG